MREFLLDEQNAYNFYVFNPLHIILLFITMLIIFIFIKNKNKITKISFNKYNLIKNIGILIMFLNMTIYYASKLIYGVYNIKVHLPLHLCLLCGYIFMIVNFFNIKKLKPLSIIIAFIGPIPATIFPEIYSTFDSFIFYNHIISHNVFFILAIFIYLYEDISINLKELFKSFLFLILIYIITYSLNITIGSNYIFSTNYPPHILDMFPFLHSFSPFLLLLIVGVTMLLITYYFLKKIK